MVSCFCYRFWPIPLECFLGQRFAPLSASPPLLSGCFGGVLFHLSQVGQETPLRLTSVVVALLPWSVGLRPVGAAAVHSSQGCIEGLPELPHFLYCVSDGSDLLV